MSGVTHGDAVVGSGIQALDFGHVEEVSGDRRYCGITSG